MSNVNSNPKPKTQKEKGIPKGLIYFFAILISLAAIFSIIIFVPESPPSNALFSVSIRTYTTGPGVDNTYYAGYGNTIKTNLREIGIDASVKSTDYASFLDKVIVSKDFELAILEVELDVAPHLESLFRENASLNIFNYENRYDDSYVINSLKQAEQELDLATRRNILFNVQDYLMSDIVPMVPLFTPVDTYALWNNIQGFSAELDLSNSLPYMEFSDLREGQESLDELRIGLGDWDTFNPLPFKTLKTSEELLISLFMDKLIQTNRAGSINKGGLIKSWDFVNSTTLQLTIRDNVYWQPDVDNIYPSKQLSVSDILFTLDILKNPNTNNENSLYDWIEDVLKINSTTVEIDIDADPETPDDEPYAYALEDLSTYCFPEHYLNVSEPWESIVTSPNWVKYSENPFGTGKYTLDFENTDPSITVFMDRFENWHGAGVKPNKETNLVFNTLRMDKYTDGYSLSLGVQNSDVDIAYFGENSNIVTELTNENINVNTALRNSIIFLAFNLEVPNFGGQNNFVNTTEPGVSKALAIRKAIAYAINRNQLNEGYHNDLYNKTDSPIPYSSQYYYSGVTNYGYSLNKAKEYLAIAGFDIGSEEVNQALKTSGTPSPIITSILSLAFLVFITNRQFRSELKWKQR